jgi:hypothetical protein
MNGVLRAEVAGSHQVLRVLGQSLPSGLVEPHSRPWPQRSTRRGPMLLCANLSDFGSRCHRSLLPHHTPQVQHLPYPQNPGSIPNTAQVPDARPDLTSRPPSHFEELVSRIHIYCNWVMKCGPTTSINAGEFWRPKRMPSGKPSASEFSPEEWSGLLRIASDMQQRTEYSAL